jgi:CheY-like chemotaxis protein
LGDSVGKSAVRVLVADDDALNRDFLQRLLTAHGYEVLLAENGQAALRLLLQNGAPQIALLDWEMPVLDGLDLCRAIRSDIHERYVHVLMLSGVHPDEHRIQALEAGADDFLPKPYHPDVLLARLRVASRLVERQPSSSDRLLAALKEAAASGGGDVAVREGDTVGYITFCQGKVSWAYVSQDNSTFFEQLGEELKMQAGSVDSVLASCRETGTDFYHELIERGYTSEHELRRAIESWLRRKLEQIFRLSQANVLFLPADRQEEPVYTFPLESVLPQQLPITERTSSNSTLIAIPNEQSDCKSEWERVFASGTVDESVRYSRILAAILTIPGSLGAALLDMSQNLCYGYKGLLPQVSVLLTELLLLRSLHRPGLPLELSVNQGGIYHLLVAPPFDTSLVLVLVLDSDKGLIGTARLRLIQLAGDIQGQNDSGDHHIAIKP